MSKTPLTEAIASADAQGRYLSNTEYQVAFGRFRQALGTIEAVKLLWLYRIPYANVHDKHFGAV